MPILGRGGDSLPLSQFDPQRFNTAAPATTTIWSSALDALPSIAATLAFHG